MAVEGLGRICVHQRNGVNGSTRDPVIARSVALEWSARPPSTLLLFVWNHLPAHPLPYLSERTLLTLSLSPTHIQYVCVAFNMQFVRKNILSLWYGFSFEYRLHRYVLRDETNKTRPHLHIF